MPDAPQTYPERRDGFCEYDAIRMGDNEMPYLDLSDYARVLGPRIGDTRGLRQRHPAYPAAPLSRFTPGSGASEGESHSQCRIPAGLQTECWIESARLPE